VAVNGVCPTNWRSRNTCAPETSLVIRSVAVAGGASGAGAAVAGAFATGARLATVRSVAGGAAGATSIGGGNSVEVTGTGAGAGGGAATGASLVAVADGVTAAGRELKYSTPLAASITIPATARRTALRFTGGIVALSSSRECSSCELDACDGTSYLHPPPSRAARDGRRYSDTALAAASHAGTRRRGVPHMETLEGFDRIETHMQELAGQLEAIARQVGELRKEHQEHHRELLRVLSHHEMRLSVLRHRVG
jgi:hypothetical protein